MRDGLKRKTSSTEDYGYINPVEVVEECYWERRNHGTLPDVGGLLDQDQSLMKDMDTYGWLQTMAENIVKEEREAIEKAKQQR